jgi:hypothetical protein
VLNLFWPYSTVNSISDQLWVLRRLCSDHSVPFTISHQLDPISHNLVLENLNEESVSYIEKFCRKHEILVSMIVTEFLQAGQGKDEIFVNGELLTGNREYNPQLRVRFENIRRISQHLYSFISLGGQPKAEDYCKAYGIARWADFELPMVSFYPAPILGKPFDLYFSGTLTSYRTESLQRLEHAGLRLLVESRFVTEERRCAQLRQCAFNLNIPQSASWPWLSTMRVLFGMRNGVFAAQQGEVPTTPVSPFVLQFIDRESLLVAYECRRGALRNGTAQPGLERECASGFEAFIESIS